MSTSNVFVFAIVFVEKRVWQETRKQRGVNGRRWQEQGLAPASLQHVKGFHRFVFLFVYHHLFNCSQEVLFYCFDYRKSVCILLVELFWIIYNSSF